MAGPSIGTWVKVKNKSGRTTARVIANKYGGGSYSQGQVITQSEYESYKAKRAEAKSGETARAVDVEVVERKPGGKSRFGRLMDDVDNLYKGESALEDRAMGTMARIAPTYVNTLADAGVKPQDSSGGRTPKGTPALPGKAGKGKGKFGRIADDMDRLNKQADKNLARTLGATAKMVDTVEKLEARRGRGRKAIAGKKKPKQKRLKADG